MSTHPFVRIVEAARTSPDTQMSDVEVMARYREWTGKRIRLSTVQRHRADFIAHLESKLDAVESMCDDWQRPNRHISHQISAEIVRAALRLELT